MFLCTQNMNRIKISIHIFLCFHFGTRRQNRVQSTRHQTRDKACGKVCVISIDIICNSHFIFGHNEKPSIFFRLFSCSRSSHCLNFFALRFIVFTFADELRFRSIHGATTFDSFVGRLWKNSTATVASIDSSFIPFCLANGTLFYFRGYDFLIGRIRMCGSISCIAMHTQRYSLGVAAICYVA